MAKLPSNTLQPRDIPHGTQQEGCRLTCKPMKTKRQPVRLRGKPVILFFYPGQTLLAAPLRLRLPRYLQELQAAGAVVLGISAIRPGSAKFRAKFDLPYTLLADVDEKVCNQFGVLKERTCMAEVMGIERTTFVIGPDRTLLHIYPKVTPQATRKKCLH